MNREYEPKVLAGYSVLALCCLWFFLTHEPSFGSTNLAMFPIAPKSNLGIPRTTTGVTLRWTKGNPPETTVTNLTTGTAIYAGLADAVMFSGLVLGSTNRFQAFNYNGSMFGFTPIITTLATTQDLRCTIKVNTYLVTVPVKSNQLTSVLTSTNLQTWYQIAMVAAATNQYSFVWTNDGCNRFFRSASP